MLFMLLFFFSCSKEKVKPLYTEGIIKGAVKLMHNDDNSFVTITFTGPYGEKSADFIRDKFSGNYLFNFNGLGNGTYKLSASKEGFGTVDVYNIHIFGNDSVMVQTIYLLPSAKEAVVPANPIFESRENDLLVFNNAPVDSRFQLVAFISTRNDVSNLKYQWAQRVWPDHENNKITIYVNARELIAGTTLYIILYAPHQQDIGYFNAFHSRFIFSTIDPSKHSKVLSVTIK
jgi:hypothetical protein